MRDAFIAELSSLLRSDKHVMILTGDLGYGVFETIEKEFPAQYLNVGVAEQNMIGIASGLALEGFKVFVYSIGNFPTLRCLEQIRNDACYHNLNINIVASGGGFSYGALGMSHHATEDLAVMRAIPSTTVIAPSSPWEAKFATRALLNREGVGYLRLDKSAYPFKPHNDTHFEIPHATQVQDGRDVTIITTGGIITEAIRAASMLNEVHIQARILSMHTIKPIDDLALRSAIQETGGIIIVEEHSRIGGLGSAISEYCMQHALSPGFFKHIALNDTFSSVVGTQEFLRKHYHIDANSIYDHVVDNVRPDL